MISRNDVDVRFPKSSVTSTLPDNYIDTNKHLKEMKWKRETMLEDIKREQALLDTARQSFERKKEEFVKFLAQSSAYASQVII
jgi:ATP-dependent Lon protease